MSIDFDFSELNAFAAVLNDAPSSAVRNVVKATEVTARNVKDDAREQADRTGLGKYAADIDYDMVFQAPVIGADIGPTPGDSGSFGFVEDGGGGVYSEPQHALRDAAIANEQDYVRGLLIAISEPLEGA